MKNFVKMKVRLNCDLFEAYRSLTRKDKMEKWGAVFQEDHFEVKTANGVLKAKLSQMGDLNESVQPIAWSGTLKTGSEGSDNQNEIIQPCQFVFYRMNCTHKTEYCAEIHLVVEAIGDTLVPEIILKEMGEGVLDMIRKRYNKDWVILDSDLHASILKGSL
ncbi:hypothetical protein [Fusibacter sp. 3D3]|uniref:hypothetical protein n=1 Tax=Fusibacter sp. 3D3 TaxID=1048380 RepID=UPI000852BD58|nr:hypothetical protein [Fusibacter sp. 3D3]GAU76155.1 hypothetical protein F3D3_0752 [Fusibacter sp. 3D3]